MAVEQDLEDRQNRVCDQTFICWIVTNDADVQKVEFGSLRQPRNRLCRVSELHRPRKPHKARSGGVLSSAEPDIPVTPDESGRLFLSGLVATRARLRFTD